MERPSNRSYSLRGERMTRAQSLAMKAHWDKYAISIDNTFEINKLFPDKSKTILEIGSGMGEATAQIALNNSDTGYLAVEMHKPGLAALLLLIIENQISNIKMIREDATYLLANFIPDNSIDGIHLLFPDPWPKNRQHKRRIVQDDFVELVAKKLRVKGFIHIATDWQPYAQWIKVRFDNNPKFSGGIVERPSWRVLSKFEGQGLKKGHIVTDFRYEKI
ncbi:MAG: tRNA (guanosine(46)-N7)-methyltransferase TrmB [Actinobacteria bacterium]|nr:tRNA (guanosine(46)-N7)-methyltransferase TrmB [Actinomycetota bacterium]NBY82323.1 tRNA (guanosine(46)-N7)-methyltransferase TrmB [Actinomycetota bacterium]NDD79004.1 tRNA (guanosine(46)-N7)-methyltransferase TrmB [Actinomycetota bacterium]